MTKTEIKYLVVLCVLFVGLVFFEIYRPKPIDWSQTLSNKDKIPYGTYVLYSMMDSLFPGQEIVASRMPAYNYFKNDTTLKAHYISVSEYIKYDRNDIKALLAFAAAGNSVFISAQFMSAHTLLDTLHIRAKDTLMLSLHDSLKVTTSFTNPQLVDQQYFLRKKLQNAFFFEFDSLAKNIIVLGQNNFGSPDFIRAGFGEGSFYLHLLPLAFSNYYVLNDTTSDYAFKALSYLSPDRIVIWDEYTKQGRIGEASILRVVMDKTALRWAYYIAVFGILLFVLIEGKRRQRIIPILKPLQNTTLEFVNIVSRLYFQKQDHKSIARKKIIFFLEHLRTQYHLPTNQLDEEFAEILSHKSCYPLGKTKYLVWKIRQVETAAGMPAEDLIKLSDEIEDFLEET